MVFLNLRMGRCQKIFALTLLEVAKNVLNIRKREMNKAITTENRVSGRQWISGGVQYDELTQSVSVRTIVLNDQVRHDVCADVT